MNHRLGYLGGHPGPPNWHGSVEPTVVVSRGLISCSVQEEIATDVTNAKRIV